MIVRQAARIAILLLLVPSAAVAQDDFAFAYDIYVNDSCLTTWLDLAPLLSARSVQRLREGVDLVFEFRATLKVPRRFWGDRTVSETTKLLRLTYREVTSDFLMTSPGDTTAEAARQFGSLATLHAYLRDSVEVCLPDAEALEADTRHFLLLRIAVISLTDINLDDHGPNRVGSESAVRFLFRQFLSLTDYGREEYSTRSGEFLISELEDIP